ncbi:SDR family oxidoreductase [Jatrophihabitans sp. DSM 45814]
MRVLVSGATGYIGGRLVPQLLDAGHTVRAMTRTVGWLRDVPWADQVEIATADAFKPETLDEAVADVDVAYFLIHSIGSGSRFAARDREAAQNFAAACSRAGVSRIVYLGGLADENADDLSEHLASRAEVGRILLDSEVPAIVLRAAVILGSGSASFEMLRYLTERLPVMITPRWLSTRIQPIAVRDVLRYLADAATIGDDLNRTFDIAGPDVLTYQEMMQRYAAVAGLRKRIIVGVPVLTPRLSSHWVGLVTPVPGALAKPLVESLRTEVIAREHDIAEYIPDPADGLLGFERAVELALARIREANVETRWSEGEWPGAPSDPLPTDPDWAGGSLYTDLRQQQVQASAPATWKVLESIGGEVGWYSFPLAWAVRGWLDRLVGGVGLRRGRRDPNTLRVGDALDFWRVEEIIRGELLRLRAEMRLPGLAWLEFRIEAASTAEPGDISGLNLVQKATFQPHGLAGHVYWKSIAPFHGIVFGGMIRNISAAAETEAAAGDPTSPR